MRRLANLALLAAIVGLVFLLVVEVSHAWSSDPLGFVVTGHHDAAPVDYLTWCGDCQGVDYHDGSPWVVNPGTNWPYGLPSTSGAGMESGCVWDTDDSYTYESRGNVVDAGASATVTECRYYGPGNGPYMYTDIAVDSPSPSLVVTEKWAWDQNGVPASVTATVAPAYDASSHRWSYFDCISSPPASVAGVHGSVVTVPDSNGGTAVPQLVTVSVSNPTGQKVTKTQGVVDAGYIPGLSRGCTSWRAP